MPGSPGFEQMVVATNGEMDAMRTMHPLGFVSVKRALAAHERRDPLERSKDALQADLVEELVQDRMPRLAR
ncbi:MAG: GSU2403 family nucleotidyltransferase fold protein [Janthinobacterium lividum]